MYKINTLKRKAMEYMDELTEEEKIRKINMTETFYKELEDMPKHKERINITVNGLVGGGKSTVAQAIANKILEKTYNRSITINDIAREQGEYIQRFMQDPKCNNTVVVVDEWDDMEDTGENATTEKAMQNQFAKVHAQRWIHQISCSPEDTTDPLSDIIIEVQAKNERQKTTRCFLYYRLYKGGTKEQILLGHIDIDVSWILKQEYYQEYVKRKFQKMDILTKHSIFRPKELKYSKLIKETLSELKEIAKLGIIDKDIIKNHIEVKQREHQIPFSIIGIRIMVDRVDGLLKLYKKREQIENKISKLKQEKKDAEKTIKNQYQIKKLKEALDSIGIVLKKQIEDLAKKIRISKEYEKIQ